MMYPQPLSVPTQIYFSSLPSRLHLRRVSGVRALTSLDRSRTSFHTACSSGIEGELRSARRLRSCCFAAGYPTGAVRVSFGYMSSFEDADAVIRVLRYFFVTGETDFSHELPPLHSGDASVSSAVSGRGAVSDSGEPSAGDVPGSRAPCGCLLPPGAATAVANSDISAEPAVGAERQVSAAGASPSSHGASEAAAPQQGGDASTLPGSTGKESAWEQTFAVVSSPEEPGTPTREEGGGGGFGRVSAMQTVLEALGTEPAAAQGMGEAGEGTGAAHRGAPAGDGLRVQGLCLYPIKSCAAQVPHFVPSCRHPRMVSGCDRVAMGSAQCCTRPGIDGHLETSLKPLLTP